MSLNKVLSSSRRLLSRQFLPLKAAGETVRHYYAATPPRTPVSTGELAVIGALMLTAIWSAPLWVFYHLPDYQNESRNEYTGK